MEPKRYRTGILTLRGAFATLEKCDAHNKVWLEADDFEEEGGKACKECVLNAEVIKP